MNKLWHTSDIHLSFKADGTVQKPMDQRNWSKGSLNYVGYLDKMAYFGTNVIQSNDFVVITGDITHDMKHVHAGHSLRWFRANVNGILIFIKGNHDRYLDFAALRLENLGDKVFLLDEGEIITVGPYTFGCYSDHNEKNSDNSAPYLDMCKRIVEQAKAKDTIPVMLSHYPVSEAVSKQVGQLGIKAYMSGHIHCTEGSAKDGTGNNWDWYDQIAKPTDDKTIEGCYFSTGTTDVVLNKTGNLFKEIPSLAQADINKRSLNYVREQACRKFGVPMKFIDRFSFQDPLNPGNEVSGFINKAKGLTGGSLYITHVNGIEVEHQMIFGTPKLAYPYTNFTSKYAEFPKAKYYLLMEKWDGTNILFYKYYDSNGDMFITAKTKGTAVLKNSDFGNFLDLTREALNWQDSRSIMLNLPNELMPLMYDAYQSFSMELCGKKEPHIVKYDFDIALKPLFLTRENGVIDPFLNGQVPFHYNMSEYIASVCDSSQKRDLEANEAFRAANGLVHKYEYEHFITEGKVLYLLDENNACISRTLYKIKPSDVEKVHWETFDADMQAKVKEALVKLYRDNEEVTPGAIAEELDMGPKEWDKWAKEIMAYVAKVPVNDKREVLILVGIPGSGKSTFAKRLVEKDWVRINQDELGSRNKCKDLMEKSLKANKRVIIDRCNFDINQRKTWLDLATKHGVSKVRCLHFDIDPNICKDRIVARTDHPTIKPVEGSKKIVDSFLNTFVAPQTTEGFVDVDTVKNEQEILDRIEKFT